MSITLSGGIPTWFVDQVKGTLYHVCQQRESKFAKAVRVEPVLSAAAKGFDMMDSLALVEKTARNVATPTVDPTTQRRWVETAPYHNAVLWDKDDDLSTLLDPMSDFATALRRAVNRQKDDIILAAFEATVTSGRRLGSTITWAAQNGDTKYTRTSGGRTIPFDCAVGNCDASQVGMTAEKVQLIKEYFIKNEVDEGIPLWVAISPEQGTDLFGQQEYSSGDYNTTKPLAMGRIIPNWFGLNWIVSNKIVLGSSNDVDGTDDVYECRAWAEDGIILGVQDDITVELSIRDDLSYSQQVYVHMNLGAMRMDEDKVLKVECQ